MAIRAFVQKTYLNWTSVAWMLIRAFWALGVVWFAHLPLPFSWGAPWITCVVSLWLFVLGFLGASKLVVAKWVFFVFSYFFWLWHVPCQLGNCKMHGNMRKKRAQICAKLIKIAQTNANFKKVSLRNGVQACPSIIPKTVFFFNSVFRSSEMLLVHAPKHLRLRKWLFILLVIRCWDGGHLINSQVNKTNWFATNVFFRNVLILLAWAHTPNSHLFCVLSSRAEI
jgi:hypothetical protein